MSTSVGGGGGGGGNARTRTGGGIRSSPTAFHALFGTEVCTGKIPKLSFG